jgi:hypothetical protein
MKDRDGKISLLLVQKEVSDYEWKGFIRKAESSKYSQAKI